MLVQPPRSPLIAITLLAITVIANVTSIVLWRTHYDDDLISAGARVVGHVAGLGFVGAMWRRAPRQAGVTGEASPDEVTRLPGPDVLRAARNLASRVIALEQRRVEDNPEDTTGLGRRRNGSTLA